MTGSPAAGQSRRESFFGEFMKKFILIGICNTTSYCYGAMPDGHWIGCGD